MTAELRPIPDDDIDALFAMLLDPSLAVNTGSIPYPIDRAWAAKRLADRRREEIEGTRAEHGLYEGRKLVGSACWFFNDEGHMEIGYAVHKDHRGRGLATVAAGLAIDWVRATGHDGPIYAQYFQDNPASGRVLEKLGFALVGETEGYSPARFGTAPAYIVKLLPQGDKGNKGRDV